MAAPSVKRTAPGFSWGPSFPEPADEDEARERWEALKAEVRDIQAQIAHPQRLGPDGRTLLTPAEYLAWRGKASAAMAVRVNQTRLLKLWLQKRGRFSRVRVLRLEGMVGVLEILLTRLAQSAEERQLLEQVREILAEREEE